MRMRTSKGELTSLSWRTMRLENASRENERLLAILELRDMYQGETEAAQDSIQGSIQLAWDIYDRQGQDLRSGRWYGRDMP